MTATDRQLADAATLIGLIATTNAGRLPKALAAIDAAEGPLRAASGNTRGTGGISDPVGDGAIDGYDDQAAADRKRIDHLVMTALRDTDELAGKIAAWAPDAAAQAKIRGAKVTNDNMWCPNCLAHNHNEPKAGRLSHCRFCHAKKIEYGAMPDRILIDTHTNRKVNSGDTDRWLKRIGSKKKAKAPTQ